MLDLRLKDEMVKEEVRCQKLTQEVRAWQITFDANKTARNKDFLDEYGKQIDWDKVEEKELEERRTLYQQVKEFHKSG